MALKLGNNNQDGNSMNPAFQNTNAPKVKKEKLKNVSKSGRIRNVVLLLALVVAAVLAINFISTRKLGDTVTIATLVSSVPQDGIIRVENMVAVEMAASEYERVGIVKLSDGTSKRAVVLWEDRNQINNTYASYYIRQGTPIYWDSIGSESPKQYSYLYNMDGELLKVSLDANTFGEMLVPGDHINVRAAYSEPVYTLPTEEEYLLQEKLGINLQTNVSRQILLFNNVAILDMLNGNGESIFDMYYQLLALPKNQQEELINSDEFQASVQPYEILLNVTPEEADRYMSIQSYSPRYMMTLLPRTSSNAITEVLNELATGFARTSN